MTPALQKDFFFEKENEYSSFFYQLQDKMYLSEMTD